MSELDIYEEPKTNLSRAFGAVLVLHVIGLGGVYFFQNQKAHDKDRALDLIHESAIPQNYKIGNIEIEVSGTLSRLISEVRDKLASNKNLVHLSKDNIRQAEYDTFRDVLIANSGNGSCFVKVTQNGDHRTLFLHPALFPKGPITPAINSLLDHIDAYNASPKKLDDLYALTKALGQSLQDQFSIIRY